MSKLNPIPRSPRRNDLAAYAGQTVFGPVDFEVYETSDVRVRVKTSPKGRWRTLTSGYSIGLSGPAPAYPTITFLAGRAEGDTVRIEGARLDHRLTDVTRGGVVLSAPLEREFDHKTVIDQELRRDIDEVDTRVTDEIDRLDSKFGLSGITIQTLLATSSIAGLSTLKDRLEPGIAIAVTGYYAANDWGGGTFIYQPLDEDTDDGAFTIAVPGIAGRFKRVHTGPRVSLRSFGARGDAPGGVNQNVSKAHQPGLLGSEDAPALHKAFAFAEMFPGTAIEVPPGKYMLTDPSGWIIPSNTSIIGHGQAIFDTRRRLDFNDNGEAQFRTIGGPNLDQVQLLTHSVKKQLTRPLQPASATHANGVVTMRFTTDHPFEVGDRAYVEGEPTAGTNSVYAGYYHVNVRSTGLTLPGEILSVPAPDTITYAATAPIDPAYNSLSSSLVTYARVTMGSDTIRVLDTSPYQVGQKFMVASQAVHRSGSTEANRIGEWQTVAFIIDETTLRLNSSVREDYLVSDGAKIVPTTVSENVHISGITFIFKGANLLTGVDERGDRGINFRFAHNSTFKDNFVYHCDLIGLSVDSCKKFTASGNVVIQDHQDQGGRLSGFIDISYPIAYAMCCEDIVFFFNRIEGGRHNISQNGASSDTAWGICRGILIDFNICRRSFIDAISTHQGVENLTITRNDIDSANGGINPRFCRHVHIELNTIVTRGPCIQIHNHFRDIAIINNTLSCSEACIRLGTLQNSYDPPVDVGRTLTIRGNTCLRGVNIVDLGSESCPALLNTKIVVENNTGENILSTPFRASFGALNTSRSYTGNGTETRYRAIVSYWVRSDVSVTINGVLTTDYTWDEDAIIFNTPPASGSVIVFTSATVHGWSGVFRNNTVTVGKGEAKAWAFDVRNPTHLEIDGNTFFKEDGGIVKYEFGLHVRGGFTKKINIGKNVGLIDVCDRLVHVYPGTPAAEIQAWGVLPEVSEIETVPGILRWTGVGSAANSNLGKTLVVTGDVPVTRDVVLPREGHEPGIAKRLIRTGGGAGGLRVLDEGNGGILVNALAPNETADFLLLKTGGWRLMNRQLAPAA